MSNLSIVVVILWWFVCGATCHYYLGILPTDPTLIVLGPKWYSPSRFFGWAVTVALLYVIAPLIAYGAMVNAMKQSRQVREVDACWEMQVQAERDLGPENAQSAYPSASSSVSQNGSLGQELR